MLATADVGVPVITQVEDTDRPAGNAGVDVTVPAVIGLLGLKVYMELFKAITYWRIDEILLAAVGE